MTLVICSPDTLVRKRWLAALDDSADVIQTASTVGLISKIREYSVDQALIHRPSAEVATIRDLKQWFPECKLILLSDNPDTEEGVAYLRAGAVGYANSYMSMDRLRQVSTVTHEGGIWVGQKLMQRMIEDAFSTSAETDNSSPAKIDGLTHRENEIAELIAKGKSNKEIGSLLNITERTVKAHLNAVYRKSATTNRLQLALLMRG